MICPECGNDTLHVSPNHPFIYLCDNCDYVGYDSDGMAEDAKAYRDAHDFDDDDEDDD